MDVYHPHSISKMYTNPSHRKITDIFLVPYFGTECRLVGILSKSGSQIDDHIEISKIVYKIYRF